MDRLFGKELSNVLNHGINSRQRNQVKLHSRSGRGITLNDMKHGHHKANKSVASQNVSMRGNKTDRTFDEKELVEPSKNVQMVPDYFD